MRQVATNCRLIPAVEDAFLTGPQAVYQVNGVGG
jgi:hypothetical protein